MERRTKQSVNRYQFSDYVNEDEDEVDGVGVFVIVK